MKYMIHDLNPDAILGSVRAADMERLADAAVPDGWDGDSVVLSHRTCELIRSPRNAALPITLRKLEYELLTVAPVKNLDTELFFAPLGLIKMFNSGGAMRGLEYDSQGKTVEHLGSMHHKDRKLVYSTDIPISYNESSGLVSMSLSQADEGGQLWTVNMRF